MDLSTLDGIPDYAGTAVAEPAASTDAGQVSSGLSGVQASPAAPYGGVAPSQRSATQNPEAQPLIAAAEIQ